MNIQYLFKLMSITLFAFFLSIVPARADDTAKVVIQLQTEELSVGELISEIERQTDFTVLYRNREVDTKRIIHVLSKSGELTDYLNMAFTGTDIAYEIDNNHVLLSKKQVSNEGSNQASASPSQQTERTITGTVKDSNGELLAGAGIMIKGTSVGVSTGTDGRFSLKVPQNATLQVSFIGYLPQEIATENLSTVDIVLVEDPNLLDEIVVVGYGTQKRLNVTGAVAAISAKQLKQSPVANISNALAGRLPGLITVQTGGEPGNDAASIWIRGFGTYGSAQSPIIMVDGIERSFNDISMNEIESISILKDASSTAIYGVRGANGVVVVTTKRGTEKKPLITANFQTSIQQPTRLPEYLDSYNSMLLYREGLINDGLNSGMYSDEYINKFRDRSKPAYEYLYPSVDWQEALIKDYSSMNEANINVNGSNNFVKYFVSMSYLQQNGLYKYEDQIEDYNIQARLNRYNFRANTDISVFKDLDMEMNIGGIIRDRNYPNVDASTLWGIMKSAPAWNYPLTNPDGSIPGIPSGQQNPYGLLTQTGYRRNFEATLQTTVGFTWRLPWITEGLSLRGRLSFDAYNYRNVTRNRPYPTFKYNIDEDETDLTKGAYTKITDGNELLDYAVNANGNRKTVVDFYVNYERLFGLHQVKGLLLYTQQSYLDAVGGGRNNAIAGMPYNYQGFVGRVEYSYRNRYFADFNFGYNGSENFKKGQRFGFFPALSVSWIASEENFFKENLSLISLLKIRASIGEVGNDQSGSRFLYQGNWSLSATGYQFGENRNGDSYGGATENAMGNENVTWERARKYNVGLDLGLWKGAIKLEVDFFDEYRSQILTNPLTIPDIVGVVNLPKINAGIVRNRGYEVVLTHRQDFANFGYFVRVNYSFARNKILDITEPDMTGREYQQRAGRRINEHYGLKAIGLFRDQQDIEDSPTQGFNPVQPGDIKYADMNGDNEITPLDETYLGRVSVPEAIAGIAFGFHYKGFDASVLFQGAFGSYVYYGSSATYPFSRFAGIIAEAKDNHFHSETNPDVNALYPRMTSNDNANNYRTSDFWHRKTDYVRLKNLEIGYALPGKLLQKIGISSTRIYLNGFNLFTWSELKTFDPEIPGGTGAYPQQRVYNLGLNFSF
jgi:TonB-linked SusC/RagA family outer membrane protein